MLQRFTADFDQLAPPQQREVVDALTDMDFQLMNLPLESGESRGSKTSRVLFNLPVVMAYRVTPRMGLVEIVGAKMSWKVG